MDAGRLVSAEPLSCRARLGAYKREAETLLAALDAGDPPAEWRFKWEQLSRHWMVWDDIGRAVE